MLISDWSSDVCSSDLWLGSQLRYCLFDFDCIHGATLRRVPADSQDERRTCRRGTGGDLDAYSPTRPNQRRSCDCHRDGSRGRYGDHLERHGAATSAGDPMLKRIDLVERLTPARSEEHTSELQSLMRISYAVFCLQKKKTTKYINDHTKLKSNTLQS